MARKSKRANGCRSPKGSSCFFGVIVSTRGARDLASRHLYGGGPERRDGKGVECVFPGTLLSGGFTGEGSSGVQGSLSDGRRGVLVVKTLRDGYRGKKPEMNGGE